MPLADLPIDCLQGRLGEICLNRFNKFPRAYAWIALLAAASAKIDQPPDRVNLYGCIVGGVHSGKSQAIDASVKAVGLETPFLMQMYAGSAEALARAVGDAAGNPRLWAVDELGFLLEKAHIEHSTIPQVLCTAFDHQQVTMNMGKRQQAQMNCSLSILGGMVEDRFSDLFGKNTTAGLYDRFMFGLCPSDFEFDYYPFNGAPEIIKPQPVKIDPLVWEWRSYYLRKNPEINPRIFQIAMRVALVCTYFDGEPRLTVERLKPHKVFMEYQSRMREFLKPNPGENFEGQLQHKFLNYLKTRPGFVSRRQLFHDTRAYDKGLSVAERALDMLIANDDVIKIKAGKQILVRLALESENEIENAPEP